MQGFPRSTITLALAALSSLALPALAQTTPVAIGISGWTGFAPLTLCNACGHRMACQNCDAWLVDHRFKRRLICHHCGFSQPLPEQCPKCAAKGSFVAVGPGVERLEQEIGRAHV